MRTMIFPNLPVNDLPKATAFYEALGYKRNTQFSNDDASAIMISEEIVVMLLTRPFFGTFTSKTIIDATSSVEMSLALSADSREDVDALVEKALAAGARKPSEAQDLGFMYSRAFEDLDGHHWEVMWMNPATVEPYEV
ncbi:MAG TPA: VOC family protein [Thermomicrobiales bacterium]|nr:VOC family protein [Thermomicrobiales bacterium]